MKITIFGENSYIGNAFAAYSDKDDEAAVKKISSRNGVPQGCFSGADCVLFCAGIAHRKAPKDLHYNVNRDLAIDAAKQAKACGVGHFVYLSSAAVFGDVKGIITAHTPTKPTGAYGKSKLEAEDLLKELENTEFTVTIVRPPMVYGRGCKGNFRKLVKLVKVTPVFPHITNRRSMVFIDNLCVFIADIIKKRAGGTFFPQNAEYTCTSQLALEIAKHLGKKLRLSRLLGKVVSLFLWIPLLQKLFGDYVYQGEECEKISNTGFSDSVGKSL